MGIDFWLYWSMVLGIALWLTGLTYHFLVQRNTFNDHKTTTNKRLDKVEYTVDDLVKVLKTLKE